MKNTDIKPEKAVGFRFLTYRISEFSYSENKHHIDEYDIHFTPSGVYNPSTGKYELTLEFKAEDKSNNQIIMSATGKATYEFDDRCKFEQLPSHFFLSAIPIFFPYMRSFVSTLSLLANTDGVLILGLINFTNMAEPLKENTTIIK